AMEVRVKEGHVIVKDATGRDSIHLTAGEGAAWQSDEFIRLESELQPMGAWRLEPVMFSDQPLREIIPIIEREYQIAFDVADPNLVNCAVTFTLNYPPLPVLIETLETLLDIEILNRGSRQYFIQGSGC
ncbi:MAG: DUF4974 domain-containing protein, partial [Saprospiraceae bacterium]|nr:DUF4974 domain-containing protein [Saprospiraceae bacterium]